jgi:hypothetical protein
MCSFALNLRAAFKMWVWFKRLLTGRRPEPVNEPHQAAAVQPEVVGSTDNLQVGGLTLPGCDFTLRLMFANPVRKKTAELQQALAQHLAHNPLYPFMDLCSWVVVALAPLGLSVVNAEIETSEPELSDADLVTSVFDISKDFKVKNTEIENDRVIFGAWHQLGAELLKLKSQPLTPEQTKTLKQMRYALLHKLPCLYHNNIAATWHEQLKTKRR